MGYHALATQTYLCVECFLQGLPMKYYTLCNWIFVQSGGFSYTSWGTKHGGSNLATTSVCIWQCIHGSRDVVPHTYFNYIW